jgi:hypothetical protein
MLTKGMMACPVTSRIELDDFCHETAILSLWLAEHQMNNLFRKEFDVKIQALPLRPSGCHSVSATGR